MIRRLAPVVVAGIVLAACGSGADDATSSTSSTASTSTPSAAAPTSAPSSEPVDGGSAVVPGEAPAALQFSAPLIGGGDIELTTLAGRPVLLWFWAPW